MVLTHNSKKNIPWSQDNLLPSCPVIDAHMAFVRPVVWDPYLWEPVRKKIHSISTNLCILAISTQWCTQKVFDWEVHRWANKCQHSLIWSKKKRRLLYVREESRTLVAKMLKNARFRISIVGNFFMKYFLLIYALIKLFFFFFALWLWVLSTSPTLVCVYLHSPI